MKLGKRELDGLTCPTGRKDQLVFDDELDGFAVRVTAAGTKTFLLQYRRGDAVRRLTLGRYGQVTPAQARKLAEAARGDVAAGRDPVANRRAALEVDAIAATERRRQRQADAFTLAHMVDVWEAKQLAHRSLRHRTEAARAIRFGLARLLTVPASAITPEMAQRALDAIPTQRPAAPATASGKPGASVPRTGETMALRTRAYGHAMFAWGVKRRLVLVNPFAGTTVEAVTAARQRVLSDPEIGELWRATAALGWPWGHYFRFLLLTLQREAETAGLRWAELSEDLARWDLPGVRTKNGRAHIVHLAEPARAILRDVRQLGEAAQIEALAAGGPPRGGRSAPPPGSAYVFSTTGVSPISGFSHGKARIDAVLAAARAKLAAEAGGKPAPLPPWRIHDFRRTGVTALAGLGVRWEVADKLLNHVTGAIQGVAAVYQRHDFLAERRTALEAWAAHVLAVAGAAAPASNVIAMPRQQRGKKAE